MIAGGLPASRSQRDRRAHVHSAHHVQHHQEAQERVGQVQRPARR